MKFSLKKEDKKNNNQQVEIDEIKFEKFQLNEEQKEEDTFNPWKYVRVVNIKGEKEYQPTSDEKVIVGHRENPILGNKHIMIKDTINERERVIKEYQKDLEKDIENNGPISNLLNKIADDILEKKEKIAFSCFCLPKNCHCQLLVSEVVNMIEHKIKNDIKNNKIKI